jgi:2-polyprenyl-3-methyl-5-hydroxy-6-metoxy-1,4-benzoquinol methylase
MHILVEEFLNDNVEFKGDCYEVLIHHREKFIDWRPNADLIRFLLEQLLPFTSSSFKSIKATAHEIADHYDRGNDFFNAFLGPRMIYTSAFYKTLDETLEQAQDNKLNMLCEKAHLKPGMTYLDIGCGWGTLVRHAAKKFGAKATGVTLSAEGAAWCRAMATKDGLTTDQCEILNCDYREIPEERKFDAISAVEMAEHVGIANFGLFLANVRSMLADDGIFYMQVRAIARVNTRARPLTHSRTHGGRSRARAGRLTVLAMPRAGGGSAQGLQLAGHAVGALHVAVHLPGCRRLDAPLLVR